jgi:Replication-relaxation
MNTPQIDALFFATSERTATSRVSSRCLHRLKLLYHPGFLRRVEQAQTLSDGRKPLVYFLDWRGAHYLADLAKCDVKDLDWDRQRHEVGSLFLDHLLLTNDIRVAVMLAAFKQEHTLLDWQDERTLRRFHQTEKITILNEENTEQKVTLIPDGYFAIEVTKELERPREYHQFLEIDRATTTLRVGQADGRDWARKVKAYIQHHKSGAYEARYHTRSMRVLTITTTEKRLAHLKQVTEEADGKNHFWFTTFDKISAETIFTIPIWQVAQREGQFSFLW